MIDQAIAQPFGDLALQGFKFGIDEFDHLAGFDIDHVIVVRLGRGFVTGAAIAEIVAIQNAGFLEQAHRAVDGGNRDARIDRRGAFVQLVHIGMIVAFRQHARDYAALVGNPEATIGADGLDVDRLVHESSKREAGSKKARLNQRKSLARYEPGEAFLQLDSR